MSWVCEDCGEELPTNPLDRLSIERFSTRPALVDGWSIWFSAAGTRKTISHEWIRHVACKIPKGDHEAHWVPHRPRITTDIDTDSSLYKEAIEIAVRVGKANGIEDTVWASQMHTLAEEINGAMGAVATKSYESLAGRLFEAEKDIEAITSVICENDRLRQAIAILSEEVRP